jgi:hypothetical protein
MPASISSRPLSLAALAMILGHARKLLHFMCAGSQSESCCLRAQVLSGAWREKEGWSVDLHVCARVHARVGVFVCACSVHWSHRA